MNEQCLDALPKDVAAGRLSLNDGAMKVMEIIYTNPGRFNLLDMNEDERSDFLLDILPKLAGLLERHKEEVSPFGAYIFKSLPGLRATWYKKKRDELADHRAMVPSILDIYEAAERKRLKPAAVAEPPAAYPAPKNGQDGRLVFRRIFEPRRKSLAPLEKVYRQRSALVLALKSAWYIDDAAAQKITDYCGCSKDYFLEKVEKMRSLLQKKSLRVRDIEERRNRAWYFVCKYRERLSRLEKGSRLYEDTLRKLEYQLKSWKVKTRLLQSSKLRVSPNNEELADCLEIPVHKVSIYLKYARDMQKRGETIDDCRDFC